MIGGNLRDLRETICEDLREDLRDLRETYPSRARPGSAIAFLRLLPAMEQGQLVKSHLDLPGGEFLPDLQFYLHNGPESVPKFLQVLLRRDHHIQKIKSLLH